MALDILVVDDEPDIRELIAGVLGDEGYSARTADTAERALEEVRERHGSWCWMSGFRAVEWMGCRSSNT